MGNVFEAFADLTEAGNTWRDDKLAFPTDSEIIASFEALKPKLVVASVTVGRQSADLSARASSPQRSSGAVNNEVASDLDYSPDNNSGRPESSQLPGFVVLTPEYKDPSRQSVTGQRSRRRRCVLQSLQSCLELQGCLLLTDERIQELQPHLPLSVRFQNLWKLLYSPRVHGVSLGTFYRQCKSYPGETLILIEDTNGHVFGGLATCTWSTSQKLHFGTPQCFVFSFGAPGERDCIELTASKDVKHLGFATSRLTENGIGVKSVRKGSWAEDVGIRPGDVLESMNGEPIGSMELDRVETSLRCHRPLTLAITRKKDVTLYPWGGGDPFFMFASRDGFCMGAASSPAFWINEDFLVGQSCASTTFLTYGPLASEGTFVIRSFECWAFDSQDSLQDSNLADMHQGDHRDGDMPPGSNEDGYSSSLAGSKLKRSRQQASELRAF